MRLRLLLVAALVAFSVTGCASSQEGAPIATTVTVTETVTETVEAPPETETVTVTEPRSPAAPEPVSLTTFEGAYFTLRYPAEWRVETAEVSKGGYLDTTIRSPHNRNVMVRVDVTPSGGSDPGALASEVEAYLRPQPGYRRLAWEPATINGYEAFRWEFTVRERGVLLRKTDIFFTTAAGDSFAVLTQAPASRHASLRKILEATRASLALTADTVGNATGDDSGSGYADDGAEADFCATHDCIDYFDEGVGSIVRCADGMWSHSGGRQGACSHHGGVAGGYTDSGGSVYGDYDPNDDGSTYNWCGASRDGDGDGRWCEGR